MARRFSTSRTISRRLRRECEELIDRLNVTGPFDVQTLCDRLTKMYGRPVRLAAAALPSDSPGGLLVSTESADYIFYDSQLSAMHQMHVIAHEVGHLLWHHRSGQDCPGSARAVLPDDFSPTLIHHMLGRSQYDDPDEYAAEVFATLILRRTGSWSPKPPDVTPEAAGLVSRLERSLQRHDDGEH